MDICLVAHVEFKKRGEAVLLVLPKEAEEHGGVAGALGVSIVREARPGAHNLRLLARSN